MERERVGGAGGEPESILLYFASSSLLIQTLQRAIWHKVTRTAGESDVLFICTAFRNKHDIC